MDIADIVIVGAGIIGAATANRLKQLYPGKKIVLLDKESTSALHQTGRNSGVVHAGVYYRPGSLKATLCREGLKATKAFCLRYQIPYQQCGKLIVATDDIEQQRLDDLYKRCITNELSPQMISQSQLASLEPAITGKEAILIQQTSITDYVIINNALVSLFRSAGGISRYGFELKRIDYVQGHIKLISNSDTIRTRFLVNCAGLMSDKVAQLSHAELDFKIIPFKGEYFQLRPELNHIVKHLIYPVPDPALPFLGVQLTKMIDGSVTVGPNAVLAAAREGYTKGAFEIGHLAELFAFAGFWKLLGRHRKSAVTEIKNSLFLSGYLANVQKYCATINAADLLPFRSGIRAQAVNLNGELIHDFKFVHGERSLHVCNAPSPAATSALPIANIVAEKVSELM